MTITPSAELKIFAEGMERGDLAASARITDGLSVSQLRDEHRQIVARAAEVHRAAVEASDRRERRRLLLRANGTAGWALGFFRRVEAEHPLAG